MPKQQPPLSVAKIDILRKWILAGARDDSTGRGSQPAVVIPESYRYAPSVASVSLSPDGKLVAAAYRSEVVLVDVEGDAAPRRLPTECGLLTHVEFSPDGTLLAAVGGSPSQFGEVRFFNVADGRTVASRRVGHDTLFRGNFAPDSKSIALGGTDGAAHVVPLESTDGVRSFPLHSDWVLDVAYTPDGRMLVTGGRDKATKVCSVETGRLLRSINMSTEMIGSVACNAEFAFSSGRARTLNGFELKIALSGIELTGVDNRAGPDTKRNLYLKSLESQPGEVLDVATSMDRKLLAVCGAYGEIRVYRTSDRERVAQIGNVPAPVYCVAMNRDGTRLALGAKSGQVQVYEIPAGKPLKSLIAVPVADEGDAAAE